MLEIKRSSTFKSDIKKIKDKSIQNDVRGVLICLIDEKPLPTKCRPHPLIGNYKGYLECHIRPNLLLIYRIDGETLYLFRIGTHAELFK